MSACDFGLLAQIGIAVAIVLGVALAAVFFSVAWALVHFTLESQE